MPPGKRTVRGCGQSDQGMVQKEADTQEALTIAEKIDFLQEEQKKYYADISAYRTELERIKAWGNLDPGDRVLAEKGIVLSLHEMILSEYEKLAIPPKPLCCSAQKTLCGSCF